MSAGSSESSETGKFEKRSSFNHLEPVASVRAAIKDLIRTIATHWPSEYFGGQRWTNETSKSTFLLPPCPDHEKGRTAPDTEREEWG